MHAQRELERGRDVRQSHSEILAVNRDAGTLRHHRHLVASQAFLASRINCASHFSKAFGWKSRLTL
jgi:hypothetical protein